MAELSPEDQRRVDDYLMSNIHQVERKPFRLWVLLLVLMVVLVILSGVAWFVARDHGVI